MERTIVIRSRTYNYILHDWFMEWRKVSCTRNEEKKLSWASSEITSHEAYQIIEDKGLVPAIKTEDGRIFDNPKKSFKDLKLTKKEKYYLNRVTW